MYTYTKRELQNLDTIDQSWDGAELKIDDGDMRVWLVPVTNRGYDGWVYSKAIIINME